MTAPPLVWPEPVGSLNLSGTSDVVLLCEHASNHVPDALAGLGLSAADLNRHIAWDIGAAEVTRRLSQRLDAPAFLGTASRLLIDLNRPLSAPDSLVTRSDHTDIPGNTGLSDYEKTARIEQLFLPYHRTVSAFLDARQTTGQSTRLISIHSFTPVMNGVVRPWHAGVLFGAAEPFARSVAEHLKSPGLVIGLNEPYKTSREQDYAIPVHGDDRGIPAIMIEIRQDLIGDAHGAQAWAERLATVLSA